MTDTWHKRCFYCVSIKSLIRNADNQILMVQEKGGDFSLPGGGLDYGETAHECLKRELFEELALTSEFRETLLHQQVRWLPHKNAWLMWLTYEITYDNLEYSLGDEADEVRRMTVDEITSMNNVPSIMIRNVLENKAGVIR